MTKTAQVTSKTGKTVVLTNTGTGVSAAIPELGRSVGPVEMTAIGFRTTFPTYIGGKLTYIEIALDDTNMQAAKAVFAAAAADVAARDAELRAYDARHNAIIDLMMGK